MLKKYFKLYRNCNHNNLSGEGGVKAEGRWNEKGIACVYTSEHPALALTEKLVHSNLTFIPPKYKRLNITALKPINFHQIPTIKFPKGWQANRAWSIDYGSTWLLSNAAVALKIPSVIMPNAYNYLLNPNHPDMIYFGFRQIEVDYDERLRATTQVVKELIAFATIKLGNARLAAEWFDLNNLALNSKTPLDILENLHLDENKLLLQKLYEILKIK